MHVELHYFTEIMISIVLITRKSTKTGTRQQWRCPSTPIHDDPTLERLRNIRKLYEQGILKRWPLDDNGDNINCKKKDEHKKKQNKIKNKSMKSETAKIKNEKIMKKSDVSHPEEWCHAQQFDGFDGYILKENITAKIEKQGGKYQCIIKGCENEYVYKSDCKTHIMKHLGLYFVCATCGEKTNTAKSCREHIKAKHKTAPICVFCKGRHQYRAQRIRCKAKYDARLK